MKILQINTTVNTTSTGRITEEIGKTLQDNGFESYVACKKVGPNGSHSNIIQIGNDLDRFFHGFKTRFLDQHGFGSTNATHNLIKNIDRINPDVISLHNLHGYYLNIEVLFNYLKNVQKPVTWTFHDCWPFTGHCSFFDYVSCDKWKTECYSCPLSDRYPASWFLDNSRENFYRKSKLFNGLKNMTIITPSEWLKKLVSQSFLSDYPVEVINNGIDLNGFKPVSAENLKTGYNLLGKKIILGVASVWDRRKGLDYFIKLSKRLDDRCRIILIGLAEEKIRDLPENVIGIQRTENIDELVSFYSAADVFVNPTLVDNFPTTNLEALACGTPVVTFNTGGSPEAIDSKTGDIAKQGDIKDLHASITKILEKGELFYKKNCRKRAEINYNKKDRFRDYLNLFKDIFEKSDHLESSSITV